MVLIFLQNIQPGDVLSDEDREVTNAILSWVAGSTLPSEEFEGAWEEVQLATGTVAGSYECVPERRANVPIR